MHISNHAYSLSHRGPLGRATGGYRQLLYRYDLLSIEAHLPLFTPWGRRSRVLQMEGQRAQVALGGCPCLDIATPKRPGKASVVKSCAICKASMFSLSSSNSAAVFTTWPPATRSLLTKWHLEKAEQNTWIINIGASTGKGIYCLDLFEVSRNSDGYTGLCETIIWHQALILDFRGPRKSLKYN